MAEDENRDRNGRFLPGHSVSKGPHKLSKAARIANRANITKARKAALRALSKKLGKHAVGINSDMTFEIYGSSRIADRLFNLKPTTIAIKCRNVHNKEAAGKIWFWEDDSRWREYVEVGRREILTKKVIRIVSSALHCDINNEDCLVKNRVWSTGSLYEEIREQIREQLDVELTDDDMNAYETYTVRQIVRILEGKMLYEY